MTLFSKFLKFLKFLKFSSRTVKGSRPRNEDADAFFRISNHLICQVIADGHGGSRDMAEAMVRHFERYIKEVLEGNRPSSPREMAALMHRAYQEALRASLAEVRMSGTTFTASITDLQNGLIYFLTLGDSQGIVFETDGDNRGRIPELLVVYHRDFGDDSVCSNGDVMRAVTPTHDANNPRELARYRGAGFVVSSKMRSKTSPLERRNSLVLNACEIGLEPTRAAEGNNTEILNGVRHDMSCLRQCPEVLVFEAPKVPFCVLLTCDGPFSKNAFPSEDSVALFLANPDEFLCKMVKTIIPQTIVRKLISSCNTTEEWFRTLETVKLKLPDKMWKDAFEESYTLFMSAMINGLPSITDDILAALENLCHLAVSHVSDDNVTLVAALFAPSKKRKHPRVPSGRTRQRLRKNARRMASM